MPHVTDVQSIISHDFFVVIFHVVVRVNNIVTRKWKNDVMNGVLPGC